MSVDWTKIDGYREDMTAEEKLSLLESINTSNDTEPEEKPVPKPSGATVSKLQFDKVSSELAALKKQMRSRMSEDEQKEEDRKQAESAMREELELLRKEKTLASHKASFISQGYDEAMAQEAATALTEGDTDGVFAVMKKYNAALEKNLRAKILKETPVPPAGDDPDKQKKAEEAQLRKWFGLPPKV